MSVLDSVFRSDMNFASHAFAVMIDAIICVCLLFSMTAAGAEDALPAETAKPAISRPSRQSLLDIRFKDLTRQELDFSCGAAALSTLLTYYFSDPTPEADVLETLEKSLSEEENRQRSVTGYSLLDLKNAAEAHGYDAAGYRLSIEQLQQLASPVIVYVVPMGYKHFAVLRGVVGDRVWLADPSRGNLRMSISRFKEEWGGVAFVLGKEGESDIGLYPLNISELRDTQPDRLRMIRHLDITDRLLAPRVVLPSRVIR